VLATPKLDGIRCLLLKGDWGWRAVSRKFKPIPNKHIRTTIETLHLDGELDGEIMIEGRAFNDLSGDVRRESGTPDFYYAVFDYVDGDKQLPYAQRMVDLDALQLPLWCRKIIPVLIKAVADLEHYEEEQLLLGYEGVMVRSPLSPYKCGRSTTNEEYLLKIKRFEDDEAVILGYEEEMQNTNLATRDAFGRTERSSCKDGLVGKGRLGKLICQAPEWPKSFDIGTGFDAATRLDLWGKRKQLPGKTVKFKHQPSGAGERPRFPVFLGFRDAWDL
jgi:DNA ligase-1